MSSIQAEPEGPDPAEASTARDPGQLEKALERGAERLAQSRPYARARHVPAILELCRRLMATDEGLSTLYRWSVRLEEAGIFNDSDYAKPEVLVPGLVSNALDHGGRHEILTECLSLLRILAIANGDTVHPGFSAEQARHFLTQVLALNLSRVFTPGQSEAARASNDRLGMNVDRLFQFLAGHTGYEEILGSLCTEIWRILGQRPIQVQSVRAMITQIAVTLSEGKATLGETRIGAERLIAALFGPTQGCLEDPGITVYESRLATMDASALQQEAYGFARAMHDVGLVSDYHAVYLRWLLHKGPRELIADALGLSNTGLDSLRCYPELVHTLIEEAVHPETAQSVYALAMLLERGLLYTPAIAPALWRQIRLELSHYAEHTLAAVCGSAAEPRTHLLAGVIALLGQPLGVGQGNNPTCQSARAISLWSMNNPDYLLHLIAQVARYDNIRTEFEGTPLDSATLPAGLVSTLPLDNDPASTLLVPHLDRIYNEMGRRCAERGEDPHRWINPEFHGWWVGREFAIAVDIHSGLLHDYDAFLRRFFASYHPLYNGNQPVIHPQPAGLAVTDSDCRFIGWHAISLLRVALDQHSAMRVYFYNPNNDSGQDWGGDVVVSTQGHGERFGESSLPFNQLASRIYLYHAEPTGLSPEPAIPAEDLEAVAQMARESWASERTG